MKRKVLSVLLAMVLTFMAIIPALTVANAGVWSGALTVPSISEGVYQINSGEKLAWFSNAVNSGNTTIKGILTADIVLNSSGSLANEWVPIGTESNPFSGTFDGNGYTISGLYVNSSSYGVGLFGYAVYSNDGTSEDVSAEYNIGTIDYNIQNVVITDSSVSGAQNVGGIIGYASYIGLLNCSYSGSVSGTENSVGGLVGWACASSVISQCHSSGTVSGHQRVGGAVGYCSGNAVVAKCYGDSAVTGYKNVGGLVGTLSAASLRGGFFLGSVSANDRAGGLVGYSAFGSMKGAYTLAPITNTGTGSNFGGAVGVTYGGDYTSLFYSYETAGFDGPEGLGRTSTEIKARDFVKEINRVSAYFCYDYTSINNGYPVLTWMLQTDVWAGDQTMPQTNSSGTYLISKPSELAWFAGLVNGTLSGIAQNSAANAVVTDNLLFNIDVNDDSMSRNAWTPIGTSESPYTGTFNGAGYNIAGIYTTTDAGTNGTYVGLFGYVGAGSISGVVLIDGLICGKENVGGVVGFLTGGSVTNCLCNSEVQGDKAVGGLVGNLGSSSSTITTSAMIGTVVGTNVSGEASFSQNVGGLVGYSNKGVVTKSFSAAHINATVARFVGGIMGNNSNGSVTSCYSMSTVAGNVNVGGLVGYNNNGTVSKCYTAGKVSGTSQVGIAFGTTSGSGVSSCYYDESFKSLANTVTGATSKTPDLMTGLSSVSNLSLGSDFSATAHDTYFYYYPQITLIKNSSLTALQNASVESVRRVQNKYIARVEIDGRTDTYYETLEAAFIYAANTASSVLPTVFLVRDKTIDTTLNISSTVCFFGEDGAVLTRASTLTGAMIDVTGDLAIGSNLYGDDDETEFYIDGANIPGTASAIVVENGATLRVYEGVQVQNCRSEVTSVRGAAVNAVNSTVAMSGGKFVSNISKSVAGAIYVEMGTLSVTGGTLSANESGTQGGAIYNNNGTVTISGGTLTGNIAKGQMLGGGAVSGYGVNSVTTVTGDAVLTANCAEEGGALCVRNYATLEINGGTITENRAYSKGGAVYIESGSEATVTGGTISGNYSDNSLGNAVYNDGSLTLDGSAQIASDNDVYLTTGKYITIADRLTCSGYAATITPAAYTEGTKVLDGDAMITNYSKFGLSNISWRILATGKITSAESTSVAILSKEHAYSVEYTNLADAFAAVESGETAIITLVSDCFINSVITVNGDVTLTCDDNSYVATRSGSFYGVMFDVKSGAILRFGDSTVNTAQQAQSDYNTETETAGQMVIDGGYLLTGVTGAAAVNVQSGGEFYMNDDAIIRNCNNTTTGTVTVTGIMHMYGGTLSNNSSKYGTIYVKAGGVLNTYGGVIANNTSTEIGDAIYSLGKVVRNIHSYQYYYIETLYDEETGEVSGMADEVYEGAYKTDILICDDVCYLNSNLIYVAETEEKVYIRSLSSLPATDDFTLNNITIHLKTYTAGNVAVTGTNVADYYTGFTPYKNEYVIGSDGKLSLVKLLLKSSSAYQLNQTKAVLSGIDISSTTVSALISSFTNSSTYLRVISADGTAIRGTQKVTTGCKVCLLNASGTVIDEVTVVVYGDVNADMKIDGQDAVLIKMISAGMLNADNATFAQLESADVNFNGTVTDIDAESVEACGLGLQTISQTA